MKRPVRQCNGAHRCYQGILVGQRVWRKSGTTAIEVIWEIRVKHCIFRDVVHPARKQSNSAAELIARMLQHPDQDSNPKLLVRTEV